MRALVSNLETNVSPQYLKNIDWYEFSCDYLLVKKMKNYMILMCCNLYDK